MLEVDNKLAIYISHGDMLDITFNIEGLDINEADEVYLTVKNELSDATACVLKQCSRLDSEANAVRIIIPSAEMACLVPGRYWYDLVYKTGDNKRTLNYPAPLIVREVVHDV